MIQQLEEAKQTLLMLADENVKLRSEIAALKGPPKPTTPTTPTTPAAPASLTPMWDRFNAIKDPAARQAFWVVNEDALKAEQKVIAKKGAR
jgi:hypothetical protein